MSICDNSNALMSLMCSRDAFSSPA